MTGAVEHGDFADALGAYALGALPEEECARVREHVSGCRECRAELDWLRAAVDTLPGSVPQVQPPPELKARVMEIVEAEAKLLRAAGDAADLPEPPRRRRRWRWPGLHFMRTAPALALAGAAVAAVVVVLATSGGSGTRTVTAQVTGRALASGARVSLQIRGARAALVVSGLPRPAAGHVDELWVKRGAAPPVPAGTFVVESGTVQLARAVQRGDVVMVTVERGAGAAAPTTAPFIVAHA